MNKNIFQNLNRKFSSRFYSYKPVKRPNLNEFPSKKTAPPKSDTVKAATSLTNQLRAKIFSTGPITISDYMKEVLTNPSGGYYMKRDVFGKDGDFITSPEIGQIFGELVAIWCVTEWKKIGSPKPLQIIELGPGRGTLSRDVLRVLAQLNMKNSFSIHLVEISPFLSSIQAQNICFQHTEVDQSEGELFYRKGETASGVNVFWYRRLEDVPNEFSIVLANEFFDALPIHKLQKDKDGLWKEILIDLDKDNKLGFRYVLSKSQTPISKIFEPFDDEERDLLEYSIQANGMIEILAKRFEEYGGFGLIMDYGHFGDKTDTFRAFKKHKLHDPLIEPGTADLTADVDFKQVKYSAEKNDKLMTIGPVEQGEFLKNMEGETRLKILLENCLPENIDRIKSGYEMLTNPEQMGKRFKFFAMFPSILKEHLTKFPISGFNKSSQFVKF